MIAKIKSFFKNLASCWRYEEHLIKTCNRATPLHRKVCNAISWLLIVISIIVWLCAFPSSAASGGFVKIYSNDGGTLLFTSSSYYSVTDNMIVTDTGVTFSNDVYTYSGDNTFLGLSRNANSSVAGYPVGYSNAIGDFIFYIVVGDPDPEPDPDPDPNPLVTFNKGLYRVNSLWYNSDISTQLDGMTFYSLSEGDLFTALTVQNDELIFDDENGDQHVMARNTTTGAKWIDNSGQFVYFINDESIPQSLAEQIPTLLEYIPDVSLIEYQCMQDSWYYGVQDGFSEGYNQASRDTEGTFLGNIFGGVFDALDKFQMFGQFSFLDFIKSIIGILALIWFLRLLAGG